MKSPAWLATAAALSALAACSSTSDNEPSTASSPTSTGTGAGNTSTASPMTSGPAKTAEANTSGTPITITVGGRTVTATLNDSDVSQDFIETLPVTLPWYRNYNIEFITELAAPMTETGPFYTDVQPGDLVYYNPMDSITVIYEETSSVPTLTKMGEVTSDLAIFRNLPDNVEMRIELG
ncbi:cyclophilin-like fold protein [Nocardioides sp. SR21]|uniref:cyclophilin-like fold protein n=1 Tax=Nocardioides sp. SR21 TaxID=2919501 RepID=UPI001FAA9399|nr:cyclophilin-like fold protein [Nocardioides sp. SR21]